MTDPRDNHFRKYHEARLWIKEPNFLSGLAHDFAKFYAESDWDDPTAAWAEFRQAVNSGSRSADTCALCAESISDCPVKRQPGMRPGLCGVCNDIATEEECDQEEGLG